MRVVARARHDLHESDRSPGLDRELRKIGQSAESWRARREVLAPDGDNYRVFEWLSRLLSGVLHAWYGVLTLFFAGLAALLIVLGYREHHNGQHLDALNRRPDSYRTTLYITGYEQHCGRGPSCTYTESGYYEPRGTTDNQDAVVRPDYSRRHYDSVPVIASPHNPGEVTQPGATGHSAYVRAVVYWCTGAGILVVLALALLRGVLRHRAARRST